MGRPKKSAEEAKVTRLSIKTSRRWLAWLHELRQHVEKDKDISAMIERWAAMEAKRSKFRPPPDR